MSNVFFIKMFRCGPDEILTLSCAYFAYRFLFTLRIPHDGLASYMHVNTGSGINELFQ